MTIQEAGAALRARKASSRELVQEALKNIARWNPRINAFLTVTAETALKRADELDQLLARGTDLGPLHGIPIAHKDCLFTKGVRTTWGSKIFADFVPDNDADAVTRLHAVGAVMAGKTNLHELTFGMTSTNPHFGAVRNPWDLERIPGGSSGGSGAAIAAGIVPIATGTDTGGSIRIPASFCGVVGLKPTYDSISRQGCMPLGLTLDHVGPMGSRVRDTAVAFHAMAKRASGYVPPANVDLRGLRIGVPGNFFFDRLDPEVNLAVRGAVQTAAALGAHVLEVRLPDAESLNNIGRLIQLAEAASVLERYSNRRGDFGSDVLALIDQGRLIPATDYLNAQRVRRLLAAEFGRIWENLDCLITPATPVLPPRIGETVVQAGNAREDVRIAGTRLCRPFNVLGWPALVLPCGFSQTGLPIGAQLIGPPNGEDTLLRAGAALEDTLGFVGRRPQ